MRFTSFILVFATAAALSHAAPITPAFTIAPGASLEAVLTVPEGDWLGYGLPSPQFEEGIFSVIPGSGQRYDDGGIRVLCALCRPLGSLPAGDVQYFYFDQLQGEVFANLPRKAAQYTLVIKNTGDLTNRVILGDEGELIANPEPSTWLLMAGGLAALALRRFRT